MKERRSEINVLENPRAGKWGWLPCVANFRAVAKPEGGGAGVCGACSRFGAAVFPCIVTALF